MPRLDPTLERWLIVAGWSAIVIVWHTTLVAGLLSIWRVLRRRATAPGQYRASMVALGACVALAAATPIALTSARGGPMVAKSAVSPGKMGAITNPSPALGSAPASAPAASGVQARSIAVVIGGLWLVGSLIALVRLAGGWMLARWIRRRATVVPLDALAANIDDMRLAWRFPAVSLLASPHVEAPVVLGHRAPVILLPSDAARQLGAEAITPLIAHELAHVSRSDYAANLAQSIAEALLVFSPGVHWIAGRIREAREYCCDDLVAARCGSRPYVEALTTLAGLGAAAHARPVLSVAGPRLVVRIRRLLQEDSMIPFSGVRLVAAVGGLALVGIVGSPLMPLSASALAQGPALTPAAVPFAYPLEQDGANVALRSFVSTEAGVCGTARIENQADIPLVGVRFAGVLSAMAESSPLFVQFSDEIPVAVAPGASETITADLLTETAMPTRPVRGQVQATCMLAQARFANGHVWGIEPVTARAIDLQMRFPKVDVPRALVDARTPGGMPGVCLDDHGRSYSLGAIVGVRYEPGRFARCVEGAWSDYELPSRPAGPAR